MLWLVLEQIQLFRIVLKIGYPKNLKKVIQKGAVENHIFGNAIAAFSKIKNRIFRYLLYSFVFLRFAKSAFVTSHFVITVTLCNT